MRTSKFVQVRSMILPGKTPLITRVQLVVFLFGMLYLMLFIAAQPVSILFCENADDTCGDFVVGNSLLVLSTEVNAECLYNVRDCVILSGDVTYKYVTTLELERF